MNGGPLDSIRVLDLSSPIGTWGTRLLADLGADVVLVEPPDGDPYRRAAPYRRSGSGPDASLSFDYYQAGKRSIVLDFDESADLATLADLGRASDVVVIAPTPDRHLPGFDPAEGVLGWATPAAIVCSVTPFGTWGPYAGRTATHATSFAQSGQMWRVGEPGSPPRAIPGNLHWHLASAHAAIAILAALEVRSVVGGQYIEISAQEVEQFHDVLFEAYHAQGLRPDGRSIPIGVPPSGVWECRDGLFDIAAHQDRHWDAFLQMLDHPEELSEPSLADMAVRHQIFDGVIALIEPLLENRSRHELFDRGQAAGLPVCVLNTPAEFVRDKQLEARDFWVDLGRDAASPLRAPGPPVRTSPSLFETRTPAPSLGEHGSDLRAESKQAVAGEKAHGDQRRPTRPLEGMRVLSLGTFVAGNTTAKILAGLGAEVVKIESRSRPSVVRNAPYNDARTLATEPSGVSNTPMYASFTRGLLGVAIEMHEDGGREIFRRMVASSDVLIENYSASVMDNWGCGFEALLDLRPDLIMASLSGYGRTGPRSSYLAYGSNIANFTGLGHVWWTNPTFSDYVTATHAVVAILASRRHVAAGGGGVHIDAAQIEAVAAMGGSMYLDALVNGETSATFDSSRTEHALLSAVVACAGPDRWAAVDVLTLDQWNATCAIVGRDDLASPTAAEARARRSDLTTALGAWAAPRTAMTVAHVLCGGHVPAAAVANNEESYQDPHLHYRRFPDYSEHPDLGVVANPGSPHRMSAAPGGFDRVGPRVGQHTREILRSWANLDDTEIDGLIRDGVAFDAQMS